jgi:MSHA biogenesis protein MshK
MTRLTADGKPEAAAEGPVLQTVMMSAKRKVAVISGQVVALGEKYGDATLIRMTDSEVVLRNSDKTLQTLKMHPAVEKKEVLQKPTENISKSASKGRRGKSTR